MLDKLLPFPLVETSRLLLRKISQDDLQDMHAIACDAEVCKYMNWTVHESIERTKEVIDEVVRSYDTGDCFRWAIALKDGNRFIGIINVKPVFLHDRVNIGYWIGQPYWGHGYMPEALAAIIRLCFETLGVNRVEADHYEDNPASGRVMQKAGMEYEGTLQQYCLAKDGKYHGCKMYSITRDRFYQGL